MGSGGISPAPASAPAKKKRSVMLPVLITAVATATVCVPGGWLLGSMGADAPVMDSAAIASEVERVLSNDYGLGGVTDVECPGEIRAEQGTSFQCTFIWNETEQAVPVTVGSGDGQLLVGTPES